MAIGNGKGFDAVRKEQVTIPKASKAEIVAYEALMEDVAFTREMFDCTPAQYVEKLGWVGHDVWHAHCVKLDDYGIGNWTLTLPRSKKKKLRDFRVAVVKTDRNAEVAPQLSGIGERMEVLPDRILLYSEAGEDDLQAIIARGLMPITSLVRRASLEDVFLRLTGRSLADE